MFADDPEVQQAMRAAIIEQLKSEVASSHLAGKQVAGINRIGYFVVVVVHIILALALWAAFSEFRAANRARKPREKPVQELEVKAHGIALKTTLHGIILLALAFAFYVLFLTLVYPVVVL